jgi:hypothetical protein
MSLTGTLTATVPNGATALSSAIFIGEKVICGIKMSAAWSTAALTFQWSFDGETWAELMDSNGTAISVAAPAQGTQFTLDPSDFAAVVWVKVRSGTANTPVNQGADRVLTLFARKFYPGV